MSKPTGDGFAASSWLEDDGDRVGQTAAAERGKFQREGRVVRFAVGPLPAILVTGKVAVASLEGCAGAEILVANQPLGEGRPCLTFDSTNLQYSGAFALSLGEDGTLHMTTAREVSGRRLWTGPDQ